MALLLCGDIWNMFSFILNFLQIKLVAKYTHMHIDLKIIILAQQNMTGPAMSVVCVPVPLHGQLLGMEAFPDWREIPSLLHAFWEGPFNVHPALLPPLHTQPGQLQML